MPRVSADLRAALFQAPRGGPWAGLLLAVVLGFSLAVLTVVSPLAGVAGAAALGGVFWLAGHPQAMLLFFFASLAIPVQKTLAGLPLNAADGLLVLWCVFWPFMMRRDDAPTLEHWRVPTLVWAIAPFVLAVVVAQVDSISQLASLKQGLRIVEWFVALPVLLMVFVPRPHFWRFASVALLLVPCFFAIDGLVEVATGGRSLTGMLGIPPPIPPGDAEQIRHTFDISGRAGSAFGGAQGLAMYLVMTMSVAIAHLLRAPERWLRWTAALSLAICLAGLAATQSRGGVLGALALGLVMTMVTGPTARRFLAAALLLGGVAAGAVLTLWPGWDGSLASLVPGRQEAVLDRLIIWGVVRDVFLDNPLTGVGLGNFRDEFFARGAWLNVELGYASVHAHNTYLEILAGTGVLGLGSYVVFLTVVAARLARLWREGNSSSPVFTYAAIGTLAAYVVFAMVDMLLLQNMHFLLVLLLSLGLTRSDVPALGLGGASDEEAAK